MRANTVLTGVLCLLVLGVPAAARAQEEVSSPAAVEPATAEANGESVTVPAAVGLNPSQSSSPNAGTTSPVLEGIEKKIPIDFSGYMWVDTGYMGRINTQAGAYNQNANYMQGRFVLAGEFERQFATDFFALARVELIAFENEYTKSGYEPHTLDTYLMVGNKTVDLQVGRFLAKEVYYRGQGIELYTAEETGVAGAPELYRLQFNRGHKNEAGQMAVHYNPFSFLSLELAGVYGQETDQNNLGVRPVADFKLGGFQAVVGAEYLQQMPQTSANKVSATSLGYAGRVQYTLGIATLGVNYGWADLNRTDINGDVDSSKTAERSSMGGFLDFDFWHNSIGLGFHRTSERNHEGELNTHDQMFLSYLYRLPVKGLSAKAVLGYAQAHFQEIGVGGGTEWDNSMTSFRLRLAYEFN